LTDSNLSLHNFFRPSLSHVTPDSAIDSIVVLDTMYPADADYIAIDSMNNKTRIHIHYAPKPDTLAPVISVPQFITTTTRFSSVTEQRPWDRGLATITLAPGATNLVLDSVQYFDRRSARAFLRIPNLADSSGGCLEAV